MVERAVSEDCYAPGLVLSLLDFLLQILFFFFFFLSESGLFVKYYEQTGYAN